MGKLGISYTEYGKLIDALTVQLTQEKVTAVHGLPRGGLPIAVHLSHHLEIPMIINLHEFIRQSPDGKLLVVDDIIDTGKTYDRFFEFAKIHKIKNWISASLYYKPKSTYRPDFFIKETTSWIVFPWEQYDEKPSEFHQNVYKDVFNQPEDLDLPEESEDTTSNDFFDIGD
jgi:hypoxanthine phosphoribosyltransferase